jgi:DNA-binding CsgD family transcriptional regulator
VVGVHTFIGMASHVRATGLVGRDGELAVLHDRLMTALGGDGQLVLISGQAGIGKTTLATAVEREASERGALVLTGRCYDLTDTPHYGPWLEIVRDYPARSDDLLPLPPAIAQRDGDVESVGEESLAADLRRFLAAVATRRPLVLILEDLHWSDPASLDLLRRLGRDADRLPLLLVVTYRGDDVARQHPLYATLPVLVRETIATRLELRPLGDGDVRALVGARYGLPNPDLHRLVEYLQARAEGNPFFVGELLRTLEDERVLRRAAGAIGPRGAALWELGDVNQVGLPVLLRQVLDRRLARLADDDRRLLAVAAIIGHEVPLGLWAAVSHADEDALLEVIDRGVEARVLEAPAESEGVRFAHALIREVVYEGLLPPRRRVWHRRVAEALLAEPRPDPDAVAFHFRQARDARAREWLILAGERAQRAQAWLTAAERYDAALALFEGDDTATHEQARLLVVLAQLRRYTDPEQGIASLERAEQLAKTAGDRALAGSAVFDRGHLRCMARDFQRGLFEMKEGLAVLGRLAPAERAGLPTLTILGVPPPERELYYRGVLALFLGVLGRLAEARAIGAVPPPEGASLTARELLGRAWLHAALGEPEQARQALVEARAAYGDQHWEVGTTYFYELDLVVLPFETDQLAARQWLADEAQRAWTRASGMLADLPPRLAHLPLLLLEGRWSEARDVAQATLAASQSNEAWRRYPDRFLGELAHAQGDAELAWRMVREEFPAGPATAPGATWFLQALVRQRLAAALALDEDDLSTAQAWLMAHDRWLAWSGAVVGRAHGQLGWTAYHRAAGDLEQATDHARQALAEAGAPRQPLVLLAARRLLGELATATGDYAAAESHLGAALSLAEACAAPYERGLTLVAFAGLRRATRARNAVDTLLREARAILEPLGASRALARVDMLTPKRPPTPPDGLPDRLSAREIEVLTLVAAGASNREIAAELVLSVRTVERHINNLYRKIDAGGRADATAYAARHGLLPIGSGGRSRGSARRLVADPSPPRPLLPCVRCGAPSW